MNLRRFLVEHFGNERDRTLFGQPDEKGVIIHSVESDLKWTHYLIRMFNRSADPTNDFSCRELIYQYVDWLAAEWERSRGRATKIAPLAAALSKLSPEEYRDLPTLARALTPLSDAYFNPPAPAPDNPWLRQN